MADLLTKIALTCALLGMILLVVIFEKVDTPTSEISSIRKEDQNKVVKLRGWVKSPMNKDSLSTFSLQDNTGLIKVVAFKPKNITFTKNRCIEIEGKVSVYFYKPEIIADKVTLIS